MVSTGVNRDVPICQLFCQQGRTHLSTFSAAPAFLILQLSQGGISFGFQAQGAGFPRFYVRSHAFSRLRTALKYDMLCGGKSDPGLFVFSGFHGNFIIKENKK